MTLFSLQPDVSRVDLSQTNSLSPDSTQPKKASPASSRKWMILDGALLNDAHTVLPIQFAGLNQGVQYRKLFTGTKWHEIADVGPLLISYSKDIEAWAQSQRPWRFGIVFESDAPLKTLANYWLTLSECQHLGLEGSLCRLYDGIILYHLLNQTDDIRQTSWFGPIQKFWLPDYVSKHYLYAERPEHKDAPALEQVMFTDPEWQALGDAKRYQSAYRLTQHVDQFFPNYWSTIAIVDPQQKHTHVLEHLARLDTLGDVTQQSATYYLNIVCRLGDLLHPDNQHPDNPRPETQHKDIVALLEDTHYPLEIRLEEANSLALEYTENRSHDKELKA